MNSRKRRKWTIKLRRWVIKQVLTNTTSVSEIARNRNVSRRSIYMLLKRYEEGDTPIALNDLQKIFDTLNLDLDDFFDHESPLGNWQNTKLINIAFGHLPEEIKKCF